MAEDYQAFLEFKEWQQSVAGSAGGDGGGEEQQASTATTTTTTAPAALAQSKKSRPGVTMIEVPDAKLDACVELPWHGQGEWPKELSQKPQVGGRDDFVLVRGRNRVGSTGVKLSSFGLVCVGGKILSQHPPKCISPYPK